MKKCVFGMVFFIGVLLLGISCSKSLSHSDREKQEEISALEEWNDQIVIGFSQLGAESAFRSSNTISMKETFTEDKGYHLYVEDGQQKQENQIMAIRTFIQQEVDYIVLAPVTETGWDTVLQEAKDAGIPVIIMDRRVNVPDESLYTCWVGSDFGLEGRKDSPVYVEKGDPAGGGPDCEYSGNHRCNRTDWPYKRLISGCESIRMEYSC